MMSPPTNQEIDAPSTMRTSSTEFLVLPQMLTLILVVMLATHDLRGLGPAKRYVSRQRLEAMLEHEFSQLLDRLGAARGDSKRFFAFANTVATRSHGHPGNGRGWLGVRFQPRPHEEPSSIIIHAHLFESTAARQQEALGVLGVNLLHGALMRHASTSDVIDSLMEDLSRERIEVDMMKVAGSAFAGVDNRLLSLQLVERGLTDAAMFTASGEVVQPSEVLHKTPILVERGSFRPATKLTLDLLNRALDQFLEELCCRFTPRTSWTASSEKTLRGRRWCPLPWRK